MIRYNPPKSQIWGHQVGRLAATDIVARGVSFLASHCTILDSQPSELMIGWNDGPHGHVVEAVVNEIDQAIGLPTVANEMPIADGRLFRQRRWLFPPERLSAVAAWFDKLAGLLKTQDVVAHSSTFWTFAWRDEVATLHPLESAGGTFGIHLSHRHKITTMFSFRDLDQYASVKSVFGALGLAELSDRHLRPKR